MNLKDLKCGLPYKWKVQAFWPPKAKEKKQCLCVAYIDARQATDMLDDVCGPENWSNNYVEVKGNVFCEVSIRTDKGWVTKSDCGTESDMEAVKGESSDAFKRACVKWGIGRFLYDMPEMKIPAKEYKGRYYPADNKGNILWSKDELTEYCDSKVKFTPPTKEEEHISHEAHIKKHVAETEEVTYEEKEEGKLPPMNAEEKASMGRIWRFVKATYPDVKDLNPDDVSAAVYATLFKWPSTVKEEEEFCASFKVES
jgi:hypothetical protein